MSSNVDLFNEGQVKGNQIQGKVKLPHAQIHNAKESRGVGGGLFIVKKDNAPTDLVVDESVFKPITLTFDDKANPGNEISEDGWVSADYHLCILAYSKNDKGYPWVIQDTSKAKPEWIFPVIAVIKEAQSPSIPFRINFRSTQAFRMTAIVSGFNNFAVATISRILQDKNRGPASINQFWLPVSHAREQLTNRSGESSWACPLQDYVKSTVKIDKITRPDGSSKDVRQGISVYKYLADEGNREALYDLAVARSENGPELVKLYASWAEKYADLLPPIPGQGKAAFTSAKIKDDFAASPEQEATDPQKTRMLNDAKDLRRDLDDIIKEMLGKDRLSNTTRLAQPSFMDLSVSGASKVIDYMKEARVQPSLSDTVPSNVNDDIDF